VTTHYKWPEGAIVMLRYSEASGLFILLFFATGCQPLPLGSLNRVHPTPQKQRVGTVYLIRGWRDLYSEGIDQLANQLEQANVSAPVFRASQWRDLSSAIAQQYTSAAQPEPLILVGFSYGADDVLRIAHELQSKNISIDLAITIDPVTPPSAPRNVKQCINYYESNGVWDIFPWLRGIPLETKNSDTKLLNQNLRTDRKDLLEPNTSHATIAGNLKLHREILRRILEVCRNRPQSFTPARPPAITPGDEGAGPAAAVGNHSGRLLGAGDAHGLQSQS